MKNLILILGAPGVGKTATCNELKRMLTNNFFIDADYLLETTPFIYDQEMKQIFYKNIAFVLSNICEHSQLENIIHCWIIPEEEILQNIISNLNLTNMKLNIFILVCSTQAHLDRIANDSNPRRKETKLGSSLENLKAYKNTKFIEIDTTKLTPEKVASEIEKLLIRRH
jgi:broad-specificity NMP kinase